MGAQRNAKRAALVHLYFNVIGTAIFMAAFYGLNALVQMCIRDRNGAGRFSLQCTVTGPAGRVQLHVNPDRDVYKRQGYENGQLVLLEMSRNYTVNG